MHSILQRLEHELDFIKGQQSELEDLLRPLESSLTAAPPPDPERERTYQASARSSQMSKEDHMYIHTKINKINTDQT